MIVQALQQVLSETECSVDSEFIERRTGIGARSIFKKALEKCGMKHDDTLIEKLMKRGSLIYNNLVEYEILFEGTVDLLEELKGKIR